MKSQKSQNSSPSTLRSINMKLRDSSNKNMDRNHIKVTLGKKWEIEVSSKSNYVIPMMWLSTLIAGFIVLSIFS